MWYFLSHTISPSDRLIVWLDLAVEVFSVIPSVIYTLTPPILTCRRPAWAVVLVRVAF